MVSIPEGCTYNVLLTPNPSVSIKNTSARKPLCHFTDILDVKHKTAVCSFVAAKEKRKEIKRQYVVVTHCKAPWSY